MIELIVLFIGALVVWRVIALVTNNTSRTTAATERMAAIFTASLQPEAQQRVRALEDRIATERAAADLAYRRKRAAMLWVIIIGTLFCIANGHAHAQGIYMGRDGRVHPQVIVGADGSAYPVLPTPCSGVGPCPVITGPPVGPYAPMPLPSPSYAPVAPQAAMPPPPPLGWVYGPYLMCADPRCSALLVNGELNVRIVPNGPITLALANGTPLLPLQQQGNWTLVAPACNLAPTGLWTTTGASLGACQ